MRHNYQNMRNNMYNRPYVDKAAPKDAAKQLTFIVSRSLRHLDSFDRAYVETKDMFIDEMIAKLPKAVKTELTATNQMDHYFDELSDMMDEQLGPMLTQVVSAAVAKAAPKIWKELRTSALNVANDMI